MTKQSTLAKAKKSVKQTEKSALMSALSEYAPLRFRLDEIKRKNAPSLKREDELGREVRLLCDSCMEPDEINTYTVDVEDVVYRVDVGEKGRRGKVLNKQALIDLIGLDLFLQLAEVKLEDLHRYLTGEQFDALVQYERVTARRLTVSKV